MSEREESNISTYLRIKPSLTPSEFIETLLQNNIVFNLPQVNATMPQQSFHFDGIIDSNATQDEVFEKVGIPAVHNAVEGFNSTIIAYGETGSGKTFTLTGEQTNHEDGGITSRIVRMLYNGFNSRSDLQLNASFSYLQLFNEKGYDLLNPVHDAEPMAELPRVSMMEDEQGMFHLPNLSVRLAETEEEALHLLSIGETNRAIFEVANNMASSRSHCIFTISLEVRVIGTDKVRRSKLNLVDLAGSERVINPNFVLTGTPQQVNSSLFYLEMVIVALYEKATTGRAHIPHRNSMLTSLLRDSLGGNCKTIMIATIDPEANMEGSLFTCKFAQRMSLVRNHAVRNEETDSLMITHSDTAAV